jgi:molybdopterin molybdotransferase
MRFKSHSYVSVTSALNILKRNIGISQLETEKVSIVRSYGRVLAENVISNINVPQHSRSQMDGFAINYRDVVTASRTAPAVLKLIRAQLKLGSFPSYVLHRGEACRILTGGFLPDGSDTIVPIEQTEVFTQDRLKIFERVPEASYVSAIGTDIKQGEQILSKGKIIRPQDIGILALIDAPKVSVYRRPTVALIPTGSELTADFNNKNLGKIPDTHSYILARIIQQLGCIPINLGVTADDTKKIAKKVNYACTQADLILTIGGSSVGKYDIVEEAINSIGSPGVLAHGVKLDRGRVTGLAAVKGKPIIILPGPIQAAVNSFIIFAYPLLTFMVSRSERTPKIWAVVTDRWQARKKFLSFTKILYVNLSCSPAGFKAKPLSAETESMSLLAKANGYIIIPEKIDNIKSGESVQVHLLPGLSYINDQFIE